MGRAVSRAALARIVLSRPAMALPLLGILPLLVLASPPLESPTAVGQAVLQANPELLAIEAQIEALEHAIPQAGVWMDPMAGIAYSNMPLTSPWPGEHAMSGVELRLQQTLPASGKIDARVAVAEQRVRSQRVTLEERRNQLVGLTHDLYYRLALSRQLRHITREHVDLVQQLIVVVRVSYEIGRAPQHDLLQLEVLRDELIDDIDEFTRQELELLAALNAAVHRPPGEPIATPKETLLPPAPAALKTLVKRTDQGRPALAIFDEEARLETLAADRAEVEKRPDVTLWLGYRARLEAGMDAGDDFVSLGASMPLPWYWNDERWGEKAQQHRARRRSLQARRLALLDQTRGDLDAAVARWRRADQKARRYRESLVPDAHRTLDATFAAYRVGRADFASVYQAELQLLKFERVIRLAATQAARSITRIATLTGAHVAAPPEGK